jgi:hypothetical protein
MPTPRLPGLPTFAGLMLAAMLAASTTIVGPVPFSYEVLKDFQPLIAAGVAFISAAVVFIGAALAYRASMAKVALDREIHEREVRRRQRGVLIRARFGAYEMAQSAVEIRKLTNFPMPFVLTMCEIELRGRAGIEDAWTKLEEFPGKISRAFSGLKAEILNYEFTKSEFGGQPTATVAFNSKEAASVKDLVEHMAEIERICGVIFKALDQEIATDRVSKRPSGHRPEPAHCHCPR